jgi:hypothetical protein
MEKLPTETMLEVLRHLDESTIHSFSIVSSKYCAIAQPLIFRRISVHEMEYRRFVLFVIQMENSSRLALMIKILILYRPFTREALARLFAVVSNLEELLMHFEVDSSSLTPHYFPNLRRLRFQVSRDIVPRKVIINDLVANFLPRHECLNDLEIHLDPEFPVGEPGVPLLAESASSVDRLVKYCGPRALLPLLTPSSKMEHLILSENLDETALHKLSRTVSGGLLTLFVYNPMDSIRIEPLPAPLLPSLFPNLRSIAWLRVYNTHRSPNNQVVDAVCAAHISCIHQITLDLQAKDALTLSAIDQLPHLRRIWFISNHAQSLPEGVEAFITKIQDVSNKQNRPLHAIYIYAFLGNPYSHTYTKASIHSQWVLHTRLPVSPVVAD